MNNTGSNQFSVMIKASKSIKKMLESFENKIENVSYNYFDFLNSLAYYIFQNVKDKEYLKTKFEKYMQKYKSFCIRAANFIAFKKFLYFYHKMITQI